MSAEQKNKKATKPGEILSPVMVTAAGALPMLILLSGNSGGMHPVEVLLPLAVTVFAGLLLYLILRLITKAPVVSGLVAAIVIGFCANFHLFLSLFTALIPAVDPRLPAGIACFVLMAALIVIVVKTRNHSAWPSLEKIICIVLVGLALFNVAKSVPAAVMTARLAAYPSVSPADPPELLTAAEHDQRQQDGTAARTLYWIILDEYADAYTMDKYYGYDASAFTQYLEDAGFNLSQNSFSNTNNSSYSAVDSVSLSYVTARAALETPDISDELAMEASVLRRTGALYTALQEAGYGIYQVSSHPQHFPTLTELSDVTPAENLLTSTTVDGRTVIDMAREMSILTLFDGLGKSTGSTSDRMFSESFQSRILRPLDYLEDASNLAFADDTAVFTYLFCPHTPFIFDENGAPVSSEHRRDWTDPQYYTDQYAYITARLQTILDTILGSDPNAIIIVQSDHGLRGSFFTGEGIVIDEESDQLRIFNAVYYGGETLDIEGLSSVNTLRAVLTALGGDYPPLCDDVPPLYLSRLDAYLDTSES